MVYLGSTKLGLSRLGSSAIKAERGRYFIEKYTSASAIYSLRKTNPTQVNCIRIRRDSDNTESDIGFGVDNRFDEAAAITKLGPFLQPLISTEELAIVHQQIQAHKGSFLNFADFIPASLSDRILTEQQLIEEGWFPSNEENPERPIPNPDQQRTRPIRFL